jgi:hypothetical protein
MSNYLYPNLPLPLYKRRVKNLDKAERGQTILRRDLSEKGGGEDDNFR